MGCVSSSFFSLLVNATGFLVLLGRQGDLLSPFFFTLIVDAPSYLLSKGLEASLFREFQSGKGVIVSSLQYTNGTIMFVDANPAGISSIKHIISCFEMVSGLKVNWGKSSLSSIGL